MRKPIITVTTEQDAKDLHLNILHGMEVIQTAIYVNSVTPIDKANAAKRFDKFVKEELFTPGYVKHIYGVYSKFTEDMIRKIQIPWDKLEKESDAYTDEEVNLITELQKVRSVDSIPAEIKLNRHLLGLVR